MTATAAPTTPHLGEIATVPSPAGAGELRHIPLRELIESPWNPRKHFDPAKLAETAESLRVNGQLTPIIVRRAGQNYEIGAGHRRYRAAKIAGLTSLLAVVRPLSDVAFLELLTVENKQRDDVAPLDEAAGFKMLMEKAGYDVAKLAARIGLSMKYVYDRLKLLQLIPEAKKYLEEGLITAGHAILLARLKPAEQKRVMGDPKRVNRYQSQAGGGLWQGEDADYDPEQPSLELPRAVTAVSVRELANYIDDHVRFRPEDVDPVLFPATVVALKEAESDDLEPVYITYDHGLRDDAKDGKVRTYGEMSWRRADGTKKSKTCAWSRIGIVAAGQSRGEAFRVCVNRDKCEVHFPESARARKRRAKAQASGKLAPATDRNWIQEEARRKRAHEAEELERARWKKALPVLAKALAERVKDAPIGPTSALMERVLSEVAPWPHDVFKGALNLVPVGKTPEQLLRRVAWLTYLENLNGWRVYGMADEFKELGIDAAKIVDQVAPKVEEKKPAAKKAKKKGSR